MPEIVLRSDSKQVCAVGYGLLPTILLISVKPLANVVLNYTRRNGSNELWENNIEHLPSRKAQECWQFYIVDFPAALALDPIKRPLCRQAQGLFYAVNSNKSIN